MSQRKSQLLLSANDSLNRGLSTGHCQHWQSERAVFCLGLRAFSYDLGTLAALLVQAAHIAFAIIYAFGRGLGRVRSQDFWTAVEFLPGAPSLFFLEVSVESP